LHQYSWRSQGPFISLNCSAFVEGLAESELFGHTKGSFTGALGDRKGAFEIARRGTLFLDEIGDLPLLLQAKLLRALENKEIRPVGLDKMVATDVRIVAATHQNLQEKIAHGKFRSDLFYRLNVLQFTTLPLDERPEDFDPIAQSLALQHGVKISDFAIEFLKRKAWPGNIRELSNMIARLAAFFPGEEIDVSRVQLLIEQSGEIVVSAPSSNPTLFVPKYKSREKQMIEDCLRLHFGNQRKAAADLGMPKSTFHDKIKQYRIEVDKFKPKKSWLQDQGFNSNSFQFS
ncbi:MAG: sigma 54-interacting transcriptional regulator, partial [Bdellovibrio sp.]